MDYEKKYKEALKWIRDVYPTLTGAAKEDAEYYFPELIESKDEIVREWLINYFKAIGKSWIHSDISPEQILSYLGKQKEQNCEDKECADFTIYHPLKNGKGKYECIPYSFYGSLTSFSEDKDLIDFLRTCFYTKEECNEWIAQQKKYCDYVTPHKKFFQWIYNRLVDVHHENPDVDYMRSFKERINNLSFGETTHWKPNEEQIGALKASNSYWRGVTNITPPIRILESLYNDLKKLM